MNIPPPPKKVPRSKLAVGTRVIGIARASKFEVRGTLDGVFQADVNGELRTMFWVKDSSGDRWRFFPNEVRTLV